MLSRPIKIILVLFSILPITVMAWSFGDAVINELMWMGTSLSPYDEYIEIRNMTGIAVDFSETSWSIYRQDELMMLIDDGVLPANGLFLICRRNSSASKITSTPNLVSNALVLTNSNTYYELYAGSGSTSPLMDIVDDGIGAPMSGRFVTSENIRWSMERSDPPGDGDVESNWHLACLSIGFETGSAERGTPGYPNYENVSPTISSLDISPDFIANDSTVIAVAYGVSDPDSIPGNLEVIFDWLDLDSIILHEIDSVPPFESTLPDSLSDPGHRYIVRVFAFDGTDSTGPLFSDTIFVHFEKLDLIINEIAWAGGMRSPQDEWIEIFNNCDRTIDFSRTPIDVFGMLILDSGTASPGGYFLVSNFAESDPRSALDVVPDIIDESIALLDDSLKIELRDFPFGESYIIDIAGDGTLPFAGLDEPGDSTRFSMSRKTPPGDGLSPSNWFTSEVSIGLDSGSLDRGSPGSFNLRNSPPSLGWIDIPCFMLDGLDPNFGTMDTIFEWKILYTDADDVAPEFVNLLLDVNCDSIFDSPGEIIPMYRSDLSDSDFTDGVIYKAWRIALPPAPSCCLYTFRASDGLASCGLGIPALLGPNISPTMRVSVLGASWRPDTAKADTTIVTRADEMPFIIHTGDVPIEIGLSIVEPDIYPHSSDTFMFSPGGWTYAERIDTSGVNLYKLSALFIRSIEAPHPDDFNDDSEDLLTDEIVWFDGDTLGIFTGSLEPTFHPGDRFRLAFRLDIPHEIAGFYSLWEHRIAVRMFIREPMP